MGQTGRLSMIKAISFDMLCTLVWEPYCNDGSDKNLFNALRKVHEYLYTRECISSPKIDENSIDVYKEIAREIRREIPYIEVWHKYRLALYLSKLGVKPRIRVLEEVYNIFIDTLIENYKISSQNIELLRELKNMGYTVVIATSTGSHDIPLRVIRKYGLEETVDIIYSSQLSGIRKNNILFYKKLVDLLAVKPSEIIHVGDHLEYDYINARKAGINSVLYKPYGCKRVDPKPCISDLQEVLSLLGKNNHVIT